ncbi:MAG: hypothetical protein GTO67_14530 [Gammaproteobacteria bacterium]|nr:hypothetical protein [Gammaproteobacteria bacterium]NIM74989.1 hypothetical protein [Gammaproteobacteria bacterium]NIN39778.1 hypothetical protein [Gammaproteobacteria bacterium]NIO26906.1 hypothetical protein [Gammaproteobacteria bacterium]NIO67462.1 hypothetical protein [Gammaproteobacteria bacterium]
MLRAPIFLACVLLPLAQAVAREEPVRRMGAYQCIDCAAGGFLSGIRQGGYGRVLREFPPNRRLCVSSYRDIDGEQYVFFQLEPMTSSTEGAWTIRREKSASGVTESGERYGRVALDDAGWPDGGDWGVKSNSWNAECHEVQAQ